HILQTCSLSCQSHDYPRRVELPTLGNIDVVKFRAIVSIVPAIALAIAFAATVSVARAQEPAPGAAATTAAEEQSPEYRENVDKIREIVREASDYREEGNYDNASKLARQALQEAEALTPPDDNLTVVCLSQLGGVFQDKEDYPAAR